MQSHTLLESQHPPSNEPLNGLTAPRMGPVPEFLRPLPVLSSSNSNTTLKYKKAAINRINQELDSKYNGYNENGELATSDRHDENNQFSSKPPSGNGVYPKHFASMQGPYGIVNKNFLKKESEVTDDEVKSRARFLSSDLLNNNTSDKVNSSQVNYSGQFQANFIGHLNNSYLHRHGSVPASQPPVNVPNSQPGAYYNGVSVNEFNGNSESRESNSPSNRNSPQRPTNTPSPQKIEQNQTPYFSTNQESGASQAEQGGNRKFKVPTSKVPKESLLKYRILHKNNQRNVTNITPTSSANESAVPSINSLDSPSSTSAQTQNTDGFTQTSSRNGSPCDNSNISNPSFNNGNPSFSPGNSSFNVDTTSHNVHFKRPAASSEMPASNSISIGAVNGVQESVNGVINSDIKPNHFSKGVLIKLENGLIKHLEDLKTEDFVSSAENSTRHRLEPSTVLKIEEKADSSSIVLTLCYGEKRHQVEYESMMEQPYYVINKGWCSFNPNKTHNKYGLVCQQLNVGDTCISLCQKNLNSNTTAPQSPNKPTNSTTSQSKTSKRKELEKHFNLLSSKDKELNERKRRRWSAPDQINEKTNKKTNAKQAKLNNSVNGETCQQGDGDSTSTNQQVVTSLPTSTNNIQQNGSVSDLRKINTPPSSYQQSVPNGGLISQQPNGNGLIPNSYYQYSNSNVSVSSSVVNSHQFPPSIPVSHLNYVTNPSAATNPTHLITRPIVSHLPLSSASTLAMSTSSPATNFSISTLSTSASSKHVEGLLPYGGVASGKISYLPHPPSLPSGMPPTQGSSNFSTTSYAASSNFVNGTPISSIVYSRNGNYPSIPSAGSVKYSTALPVSGGGSGVKNSFSNVDRLAKSANVSVSVSGGAVDFSKYSTQK